MKISITLFGFLISILLFSCTKECQKEEVIKEVVKEVNLVDSLEKKLKDSLWAYYPIKGNILDSSGNNHQLILSNSVILSYGIWGDTDYLYNA